jgi:transcriptional regulator with XRE-family HTH domain
VLSRLYVKDMAFTSGARQLLGGAVTYPQKGLGRAVRQLRDERGLTQESLGHASGVTTGAISRIEAGVRNPTWATVKRLAAALDTSLAEVAALSEELERRESGRS